MPRIPPSDTGDTTADRVLGHRPELLKAWDELKHALLGPTSTLTPHLKEEVRRALAQHTGCEFCSSLGDPATSHPDPKESLAVAFADAVAEDHTAITDAQVKLLSDEFSTPLRRRSMRSSRSWARQGRYGNRLNGLIVVLWRAGLRINEALSLTETDLEERRGSILVRHGKNDRRRQVGMDAWGWAALGPWLSERAALPVGPLFCVIAGPHVRTRLVGERRPP